MTEQTIADTAMTTPASCGDAPLPKRNGVKTLMPASWLKRGVRLEYQAGGECRETKGQLQNFYPTGCVVNIRGARTLIRWDVLLLCKLVEGSERKHPVPTQTPHANEELVDAITG